MGEILQDKIDCKFNFMLSFFEKSNNLFNFKWRTNLGNCYWILYFMKLFIQAPIYLTSFTWFLLFELTKVIYNNIHKYLSISLFKSELGI